MSKNTNLHKAKSAKNDEFYTMLSDIEKELKHYRNHFAGKVVYCNCDDARESNFFRYFSANFEYLGLKRLVCTGYKKGGRGVKIVYEGDKNGNRAVDEEELAVTEMEGDGDFRSAECVELLKEADVVVTNPPFSIVSEYVQTLFAYDKKFLIVGPLNLIKYKDTFPLIIQERMWPGYNWINNFEIPCGETKKFGNVIWFTNLDITKRHERLILVEEYSPDKYPRLDNYDAVNVGRYTDIPKDYGGTIAVPISYIVHHCPEQFEIVGTTENGLCDKSLWIHPEVKHNEPFLNGKKLYTRILIRAKRA